jgi:two-component system phosphate regulon sensor histidine kinase PhoR
MRRISSQLTLILVVFLLVGSSLLFVVLNVLLTGRLRAQLTEDLKKQCRLVAHVLMSADSVQGQVNAIARSAGIQLTLIDRHGKVLADSEHDPAAMENHLNCPEVQAALGSLDGMGSSIRYSSTVDDDLIYVAYRMPDDRFVRVSEPQSFVQTVIGRVRVIFLLASAGAVVLIFFLVARISRRITRPLTDIIGAAEEIRQGNYDKEITVSENNEVGELARILNAMSAKLKGDILKLNEAQGIRRDFVANASHELRTPVSSIKGYLETLLDGAVHDEEVSRRFLQRAMSNVVRLENIVNDMLDLSRLESRDRGLSLRYFDPVVTLEALADEFQDQARRKGLDLEFSSGVPEGFKLMADPYQFDKALVNLIENAIKYTESGQIGLSIRLEADACVVEVKDTGPGIRPEDVNRIFERFYRVDKGRSRQLGGSGLGLAIVKHVMEIHGGQVSVDSEIGRGTRFTLTFPIR